MGTTVNYKELFLRDIKFFNTLLKGKNASEQNEILLKLTRALSTSMFKVVTAMKSENVTQFRRRENLTYM